MKYGKRPLWNKILSSPISILAIIFMLIFVARATWRVNRQVVASAERLAQAQASLDGLKAREVDLSRKVANLSTDEGREAEIRAKYHAVKEGEMVAIILDEKATSTSPVLVKDNASWWRRLLRSVGL